MNSLGKLPPQAIDVEEVVLGALMIEKDSLITVIDILKESSFYKDSHKEIFRAILDLFDKNEPIDLRTVANQLRKNGKLELAGGNFYLVELTTKVNSAANIESHARILNEKATKREIIKVCSESTHKGYDDTEDGFDLLGATEQALLDISNGSMGKQFTSAKELFKSNLNAIEERGKDKSGITGVPSGIYDIDKVTSGWQNSDLIIIAARPGMGKTAFVLSAMRNAAIDFNIPVGMFSLEMSSQQLMDRLICAEAEIDSDKIKRGNLADYEYEQLIFKTSKLAEAPFYIDDTPGISILEIRAKARRLKMKHDIKLLIVDYIQLVTGKIGNREQEISSISRGLKLIAKELNIPVIALSQLSRAVETRGGEKIPQLSDLRESGSIEQDADMVNFLYRPEYYGITEMDDGTSSTGIAEFIVAKFRSGSLGAIPVRFIGKYTKFLNLKEPYIEKEPLKFPVPGNTNFYEDEKAPF